MSTETFGQTLETMDLEAFLNIRKWVEEAIEGKGGVITDGGMGFGAADLGFTVDGAPFGLSIRPREMYTNKDNGAAHASDCAVHNMPAFDPGDCDCGAVDGKDEPTCA